MPQELSEQAWAPEAPLEEVIKLTPEKVTERDIFRLAKSILLSCLLIFLVVATLRTIFSDNEGVADVWRFSEVALNSITSWVIGLYFGKKDR
jgi:hypothetical protein